ncbi:MAG: hypothetical protein ACRC8S_07335 [Fimbriiglobus sp.]
MRALWVALLVVTGVGCFSTPAKLRPQAIWDQMRGKTTEAHVVRSMLLDRPVGDAYLTRDIWTSAARPLPHELTTLLAHNGLRVGLYSGIIPDALNQAINAEHGTLDAMDRSYTPNQAKVLPVNGPLSQTKIRLLGDLASAPTTRDYELVECGFNITLKNLGDDRYQLNFEPQIQHGEKTLHIRPNAEQTGVTREDRKPLTSFPSLNFEVTLGARDYLIIGPNTDPAETLGGSFFIAPHGDQLRQRLLVLRTCKRPALAPGL